MLNCVEYATPRCGNTVRTLQEDKSTLTVMLDYIRLDQVNFLHLQDVAETEIEIGVSKKYVNEMESVYRRTEIPMQPRLW